MKQQWGTNLNWFSHFKWVTGPASWHGVGGSGNTTDDQAKGGCFQHLKSKASALLGFRLAWDWWPLLPTDFFLLEWVCLAYDGPLSVFWKQMACLVSRVHRWRGLWSRMNPAWSLSHHWSAPLRWWALGLRADGWIQGSCDAVNYSVWQKTVGFGGPEGRLVWTKSCPFKKEERLTLKQQRFELCWLTYLCVFSVYRWPSGFMGLISKYHRIFDWKVYVWLSPWIQNTWIWMANYGTLASVDSVKCKGSWSQSPTRIKGDCMEALSVSVNWSPDSEWAGLTFRSFTETKCY